MKKLKKLSEISSHYYVWVVFVFLAVLCSCLGYLACSIDNGAEITPVSTRVSERAVSVNVEKGHFRYGDTEGILENSDCSFVLEEKHGSYPNFSRDVVKELVYLKSSNQFIEKTTTVEKNFNLEKERNHKMWKSVWGKVLGIALFTISLFLFGFFLLTVFIWYDEYSYLRDG